MENKKDVGKLIKDRLANAEMAPSDALWGKIENTLDKKRRRKGGLWFWLTLVVLLGTSYITYQIVQKGSETDQDSTIKAPNVLDSLSKNWQKGQTIIEKNSSQNKTVIYDSINRKDEIKRNLDKTEEVLGTQESNANIIPRGYEKKDNNKIKKSSILAARNNTPKKRLPFEQLEGSVSNEKRTGHNQNTLSQTENKMNSEKNGDGRTSTIIGQRINENIKSQKDSSQTEKDTLSITRPKRSKRIKKDSTKSQKAEPYVPSKYRVFPFANASNYISLRKSSAIDTGLIGNKKTTVLRAGYGAYFVFKIPDKWSLRLGFSHTALQKNTLDVSIAPSDTNTNYYNNIEFRDNVSFSSFSNSFLQPEIITLKEQVSYFTVPIDVTYGIWNESDWGLEAIAGVNISILGKNKLIAVREDGSSVLLGSNKNYLKSHFGIHLGAGLYYNLNETIQLRLESLFEPRFGVLQDRNSSIPVIISTKLGVVLKF